MSALVKIFAAAGCENVRTFIQSGNVLFRANGRLRQKLPLTIQSAIRSEFGFESPLVIRSATELSSVVARNPFLESGYDSDRILVLFLSEEPEPDRVLALDPQRSPPDLFIVSGKEIFTYYANGLLKTKLTNAYFDSKLKVWSTGRNWRTVTTLAKMAAEL